MNSGYQEARAGAAFDERRDRGRVRVAGPDARAFLQALVTNDLSGLSPGAGCYAALLTPQGRMITDMSVRMTGPGTFHLIVPSDSAAPLAARLDRSLFTEAVEVADVSASTALFSVTGPRAEAVVEGIPNIETWPSDELGISGVDLLVAADHAVSARQTLAARAVELSPEARKTLRVEAGRPEFGVDMTEDTIPLEANLLDRAISTSKGCYVGQEVIIRVLHRGGGRVVKKLVGLRFDGDVLPPEGAALNADGREIGRVTSVVRSPREQAGIGLGYVHRDFAHSGARVALADGSAALVTEL